MIYPCSEELNYFISNKDWVIRLKLNWKFGRTQNTKERRRELVEYLKAQYIWDLVGELYSSNSEIFPHH